ncbi:hypothetical protein IE81DRAFT_325837 [Ceraceosorus guamensis]|uniref:Snf7-domain-containing protein n=1 Tax=Ceraceosorus guamensis TaxID=1522189 RepID=A0A316VUT9_9BASI|nr:hypothetical protein IE81DRAFT_325837 [Ceraceosorus guamensis]PWN40183.1 hypothetical protein IE81DRAFT_325837 [Ceraceosorus guamensis]
MGAQNSKPGVKVTPQDRAILDLKLQRDKVKQYQKKLQSVLDLESRLAKQALQKGDKERARTALRRRKWQQGMIEKTDGQLETLQGLVSSIEFSQIQASVMHGLQQGNAVLKEIHKELNIDSVERLMGETQEAVAYQKAIDEMLTSRMTAEEEEAVAREMEALEAEARAEDLRSLPDASKEAQEHVELPNVPTVEPVHSGGQRQDAGAEAEAEESEERVPVLA